MKNKRATSNLAGILPVLKQRGPTSHDIVDVARKALGERQIGHTGTLDPAAEGLLVLCIGPYTKLVPYLVESDKTYEGWFGLGIETTTDDGEGEPLMISDARESTLERVRAAAVRFVGDIDQIPPRYAAIKVAGKKLYEYARKGEEVVIEPRAVTIHQFDILEMRAMEAPAALLKRAPEGQLAGDAERHIDHFIQVRFIARVTSGTYVRSLARDLGRALGCGGYLLSLKRTHVGQFSADKALPAEELAASPERVHEFMIRGAGAIDTQRFPVFTLLRAYMPRLFNGQPLNEKMMESPEIAAAVPSGVLCGIAGDDGSLLAMVESQRFDTMRQANPYDSRFDVHFRAVRIFPRGLK